MTPDLHTSTVEGAAADARRFAEPDDGPSLGELEREEVELPDVWLECDNPWCRRPPHQHNPRRGGLRYLPSLVLALATAGPLLGLAVLR